MLCSVILIKMFLLCFFLNFAAMCKTCKDYALQLFGKVFSEEEIKDILYLFAQRKHVHTLFIKNGTLCSTSGTGNGLSAEFDSYSTRLLFSSERCTKKLIITDSVFTIKLLKKTSTNVVCTWNMTRADSDDLKKTPVYQNLNDVDRIFVLFWLLRNPLNVEVIEELSKPFIYKTIEEYESTQRQQKTSKSELLAFFEKNVFKNIYFCAFLFYSLSQSNESEKHLFHFRNITNDLFDKCISSKTCLICHTLQLLTKKDKIEHPKLIKVCMLLLCFLRFTFTLVCEELDYLEKELSQELFNFNKKCLSSVKIDTIIMESKLETTTFCHFPSNKVALTNVLNNVKTGDMESLLEKKIQRDFAKKKWDHVKQLKSALENIQIHSNNTTDSEILVNELISICVTDVT